MLDNNVLNLSNRKDVEINSKCTMSAYDLDNSFGRRVLVTSKSKDILPKQLLAKNIFPKKEVEETPKEVTRQLLINKFRNFYENKNSLERNSQSNLRSHY